MRAQGREARGDSAGCSKGATLSAVTAALDIAKSGGGDVHVLIAGSNAGGAAAAAAQITGVARVLHADAAHFEHGLAENIAAQVLTLVANAAQGYSHILFPATAAGKNVAPRVASSMSARSPTSPRSTASTPSSARSTPATRSPQCRVWTRSRSSPCARPASTRRRPTAADGDSASAETLASVADSGKSSFVGSEIAKNDRPELTAAKIIVSGGRALGSSEKFSEVLTPLADGLGATLGASRAAVYP
jgi:electron transfer flavoprotein alpha subunit